MGFATEEETVEEVLTPSLIIQKQKIREILPRKAIASPSSASDLVKAFQEALSTTVLKTRSIRYLSNIYRLPAAHTISIGSDNFVTREGVQGFILSFVLLAEDPNLGVELIIDEKDYGTTIADLIARQQAFMTATDWTITRQDPNVTPPQYAIAVFPNPGTWSWESSLKINLAVPANIGEVEAGVSTITVDEMVVKWVEYGK